MVYTYLDHLAVTGYSVKRNQFVHHVLLPTCPSSSNAMTTTAAPYCFIFLAFFTKSSSPSFKLMLLTIHFPWVHMRPASITAKFEESMHSGTLAMSGSEEIRFTNLVIAATPSNIPSSMLISNTWAPFSTWVLAMANASYTHIRKEHEEGFTTYKK